MKKTKTKIKKTIVVAAVILLLVAAYAVTGIYTPVHFDKPTGQYSVGTVEMEVTDSSRIEDALPAKDSYRRLILQFWYPAQQRAGLQKASYHPYPDYFVKQVHQLFDAIPEVLLNRLAKATTNSLINAPLSTEQKTYPVIIFSHGMDAMRFINTYQMEELASHGYIVVSIEHTFTAAGTLFSDGMKGGVISYEKMENEKFANAMVDKWSSDQIFTINYLQKINGDAKNIFYNKLDLYKLGVLGFSFGGAVSTNTLVLDKRIKAGVNLDGFYFGSNYTKGFEQPFMELRSQPATPEKATDAELKMSHLSRERWKYIWFDEWNKRVNSYVKNKNDYYSYTVSGADHFSFCDLPLMAPFPWLLSPKTKRIHELTNQYTLAFFDQQLKVICSLSTKSF